ncbi:MAG: hypothetical protein DWQ11_14340 [Proteobacteria bacterium]|nr:MAG: hypothetical protein DWQ11_14340 [Pseudomonadota bacterium]
MGIALLERRGRGVVPTAAAAARQHELSVLVAEFRRATHALRHVAQQTLHIDVTPVLGATWLAGRLPALRRSLDLPGLQVELSATRLPNAPADPRTDILIELVTDPPTPGRTRLFAASIGAYVDAHSPLPTPVSLADLQRQTLLRQTVVDWRDWCAVAFGQRVALPHGVTLDDPLSALEACLAGGGPALLSTLGAAPYVDSGRLRPLHPARLDAGHYAISLTERGQLKPVARRAVDTLVALAAALR